MYWMCSVPWSADTAHEYRHVLCMRIWSLGDTMHVPLLTSPIMSGWGEFMYCYVDISVRFEYEMCESVPNTIGCQFNVAHYDMILHTALQCMKQAINQRLKSQNTPHILTWWCHQMETFSALLALCVGNSLVTGEFSLQRPVTGSFDVFFDLHPNKQLSKQSWDWCCGTPSSSLCHCNDSWVSYRVYTVRIWDKIDLFIVTVVWSLLLCSWNKRYQM